MNNSKNPPVNRRLCFFFIFILAQCGSAFGQKIEEYRTGQKIYRKNGHFTTILAFKSIMRNIPYAGIFPYSVETDDITIQWGVDGTLLIDWWTLFEPTEYYEFQWIAGQDEYHIEERNMGRVIKRNTLEKYPDLLKRFDAIKPLDIQFEIHWKLPSEFYEKKLGGFYALNYGDYLVTTIKDQLLIERSGLRPFSVPGIRQGNGTNFIENNLSTGRAIDNSLKEVLIKEFNKSDHITIENYKITSIKWPVHEMKAIADLYDQYEKGEKEPTPLEQVEEALAQSEKLSAYNGEGFWGEAYEEGRINLTIEQDPEGRHVVKNNGKVTYTTSSNRYQLVEYKSSSFDPSSKYLILRNQDGEEYSRQRQRYKNDVFFRYDFHLVDYNGNIQAFDGKTLFSYAKETKDTFELEYFKDVCTNKTYMYYASPEFYYGRYVKLDGTRGKAEELLNFAKAKEADIQANLKNDLFGACEFEVITVDKKTLKVIKRETKYDIKHFYK